MGIALLEDSGHRMELAIYSCVSEGLSSNSEWLKAVQHSLSSTTHQTNPPFSAEETKLSVLWQYNRKCPQEKDT